MYPTLNLPKLIEFYNKKTKYDTLVKLFVRLFIYSNILNLE